MWENLFDIDFCNDFFYLTPKGEETTAKIGKQNYIKLKGNNPQNETKLLKGRKYLQTMYTHKGLINKYIYEWGTHTTQQQKQKQ